MCVIARGIDKWDAEDVVPYEVMLNLLDLYVKILKDKWTVEDACPYGVGENNGGEREEVRGSLPQSFATRNPVSFA